MEIPITAEALAKFDLDSPITQPLAVDLYDAGKELTNAAKTADERGELEQAFVYRLLNTICHLHFRPDEKAEPYGPMAVFADGLRTATGSDFTRDQCEALFANLKTIKSILLKARIADLTWLNNRANAEAARTAIAYFVELADHATAGRATAAHLGLSPGDHLTVGLLNRAVTIAFAIGWDGSEDSDLRNALIALYQSTKSAAGPGFSRAAELALRSGVIDPAQIFHDAMAVGNLAIANQNFDDAEWAFGRAVNAAIKSKVAEHESEAKLALSDAFERKADATQAGFLKVHALEQAIEALRGLRERERRRCLHLKLSDAQIDVQDDFAVFEQPFEVGEIVERTKEAFRPLSLHEALKQFALIAVPDEPEKLIEEAREIGQQFPLQGLFPIAVVDERGKTIAREGASEIGEASRHLILRHQSIAITLGVGGQIEPAREMIYAEKGLTEAHLVSLCRLSPFVPKHAVTILGEGFFALFQREYAKAGSHCLPYLEACLRYVLEQAGEPTTVIKQEGTESNITLSAILGRYRTEIEKILPKSYVFAIENLFDHPLGERLRHRFAHGMLSRGHFFSHSMVYGIWLMYSLMILPMLNQWDEVGKIVSAELT